MDSSISDCVKELKNINMEMMRIREHSKQEINKLKPRKLDLENKIQQYLEDNDREGLRYGSTVILLSEKKSRQGPRRKQSEKIEISSQVLAKYGISNAKDVTQELFEALKGKMQKVPCLKMKQVKYDYSNL